MRKMPKKRTWIKAVAKSVLIMAVMCSLWLGAAGAARADLSMQLTGLSSYTSGGYYVGFDTVTVNGTPMSLLCDDFTKSISLNSTWSAVGVSGTQVASMKFASGPYGNGATTATQAYQEVFWLTSQLANQTNSGVVGALHFAIWTVLDPATTGAPTGSGTNSTSYWLNLAGQSSNYSSVNMANYEVYVPNPLSSSQEFIGIKPVPVPPSMILMGTGLLGVAGLRKRLKWRRG